MTYLYFPGCSLRSTGRAYDESLRAVFEVLGIGLQELDDWNCCGATSYMAIDETQAFALAARNLALAEVQGGANGKPVELLAPCSACYLVLSKTRHYLDQYPDVHRTVNDAIGRAGLQYTGRLHIRHPLDVLVNDVGLDAVRACVKHPLKGLRVACYYGCQTVRPFGSFDHTHYPTTMDRLVDSLGATAVDWPLKTRCCGGSLTGTIQEAGLRLSRLILKEAEKHNVDLVVTCCPLCQHNLECYQDRINRIYDEKIDTPVAYVTQLMGAAFGLSSHALAFQRLFKRPHLEHLIQQKGAPANAW